MSNVKKFELGENWDLHYYEGEVTEEDVVIGEPTSREQVNDNPDWEYGFIETDLIISLNEDLRLLLGYKTETKSLNYTQDMPKGTRRIRVLTRISKVSDRNIKSMRTKHKKECEKAFNDRAVAEKVRQIVANANWHIKDSQDQFVRKLSGSMKQVESWDNKPRLEELATVRDKLREKIADIEKEMKEIMKGEIEEWLNESGCDKDIRDRVLKNSKFSYLPDTFIIH